ncbi:transporter substrate-binding protein [Svornostia abyssi]|uniref:Transporter substrate-binding protein n=1 Tax=Svornostia abyssi TaxID=2898438 RepID=A0ABY5PNU4_9ACTN|nr:transporter substrate-binding protein [Parviterribacteraceae bacterium J379]
MSTRQKGSRYWLLAVLVMCLSAFVAVGCGADDEESSSSGSATSSSADSGDTIKVGILHSLSGTMAISEKSVVDAEQLAIKEINAAGGVLGKQIEPVVEDGASDWPTFAEKAQKLISEDKVAAVFGCWTSASRKAVLPVFERNKALLYYPVQYEGMEASPYIFYTGATTNQQIIPALEYLKEEKGVKKLFLVGSDYVFRARPTRRSSSGPRRTAWRSPVRSTRRWAPRSSRPSSTRSRPPIPTPSSTR